MIRKTVLVLVVLLILASLCIAPPLDTRQNVWRPARTAVTADDTALDGTTTGYTFQFTDKPSAAMKLNPEDNGGELYFYATDSNDLVCNYKVWVWKANGPARLWCYGVATTGLALQGTGSYYVDTITSTDVTGCTEVLDSGNNRVCTLRLNDLGGSSWLQVEFDIPVSTPVISIGAEFSSW